MKRTTRYYFASAAMDFALYVFYGAIPFYLMGLGAESFELGIMQTIISISYIIVALLAGRISDRIPRIFLIKAGCILAVISFFCLPITGTIHQVYCLALLIGLATGIFWPPLQAAIADEASGTELGGLLGNFNLAWSFGKALGFLVCGLTIALFKNVGSSQDSGDIAIKIPFVLAGTAALLNFFILPGLFASNPVQNQRLPLQENGEPAAKKRKFLAVAWLANFVAFGVSGVLANQYPRLSKEIGITEFQFNFYLFCVILCQLIGFWMLMKSTWWHYRKKPLLSVQIVMIAALLMLGITRKFLLVLLTAPVIGLGFSLSYFSSIFYSLRTDLGKGKNAGIHESILRTGNFIFPLVGGWLTIYAGLMSPYIFGFAFGLLIIIIQILILCGKNETCET